MFRVIFQLAGHIHGAVQVQAHDGLELPKGQVDGVLGVIDIGDGGGQGALGAGHVHLGSLLGVVAVFRELVVLDGVLIHGVVHLIGGLGQKDGVVCLLHGSHGSQPAFTRLLHGLLHLVSGEPEALPELEVDNRHAGAQAQGYLVGSAHLHGAVTGFLFGVRCRGGIRDERRTGGPVQLLNVIHDGLHEAGHHVGHSAAGGAAVVRVRAKVHLLLLDGIAVHAGGADLGEQGSVRASLRVLYTLDFHIGHFDRCVLRKGNLDGIVQGKHQGGVSLRTFVSLELCPRSAG